MSSRPTAIERAPAWAKMLLALGVVLTATLLPRDEPWAPLALAALAIIPLGWIVLGRVNVRWLFWRLLLLEPVLVAMAAMWLFKPGGWPIFLILLARSSICLLTLLAMSYTTSMSHMLRVLRALRTPALLVTTMALMHRYLASMQEETLRMRRARAARSFSRRRSRSWRVLATVLGQLFLRALDRSERIYAAMCARGWR